MFVGKQISGGRQGRLKTHRGVKSLFSAVSFVGSLSLFLSASSHAQLMTLPGQFDVTPQGSAVYTIPIAVPPGTGGMVPALTLDYDSGGGNGLLGVGWSLGGLPSIGRCPQTTAQDGQIKGVTYTADDRFCMAGERLMLESGTYGADGSTYRTEIEGFSKVTAHGTAGNGPAWFEVQTKSGQVMAFGNTSDSRVLATGTSTARSWGVNKVTDTVGNYLTVTYTPDATNGQAYPERIDYTGNAGESLSPYNSVQFTYESRTDAPPHYQAGSLMTTTQRLTNVKTYEGANLVSDYQLTYDTSPATDRSRITDITLCDGTGTTCLPGLQAGWSGADNDTLSYGAEATYGVTVNFNTQYYRTGDLNGDSLTDVVIFRHSTYVSMLSNGDGTFTNLGAQSYPGGYNFNIGDPNFAPCIGHVPPVPMLGDIDGDGDTDVTFFKAYWCWGGAVKYWSYTSNGDGTFSQVAYFEDAGFFNLGSVSAHEQALMHAIGGGYFFSLVSGDLSGDGREDFLFVGKELTSYLEPYIYALVSDGDGYYTYGGRQSLVGDLSTAEVAYPSLVGEFNGDGKTDFVLHKNDQLIAFFAAEDGQMTYVGHQTYSSVSFDSNYDTVQGDFNGDGLTDFLKYRDTDYYPFLSTGDGQVIEVGIQSLGGPDFDNGPASGYSSLAGDYNGDGLTDFIVTKDDQYYLYTSNGDGTFAYQGAQTLPNGQDFDDGPSSNFYPFTGDFDGDGVSDFLFSSTTWARTFLKDGELSDYIDTLTTGLGASTSVTYEPLTDSTVYTKDTDAVYPLIDLQFPSYVVAQVDADNGIGGVYSSSYAYAGLKAELGGRGLLGFREHTVTDLQTNIVQTTEFAQTYPYIGFALSQTKELGALTLNETINTYDADDLGGTRRWPYLLQSVEQSKDLDGTAMPSITTDYIYDAYGNPTQVTVTNGDDNSTKTTVNTYTNDTTNWFLGRLIKSTVINVADTSGGGGGGGNAAPFAFDDDAATNEDIALTFDPRTNDIDTNGDPLTISAKTDGANGTVAIVSGGTELEYTPNLNFYGTDSFTYTIDDGNGAGDTALVNMTIVPVNDAPDAVDDVVNTDEDIVLTFDPRTNDSDVESDPLTITAKTDGTNGTVAIVSGGTALEYTPNLNFYGTDSFTYTIDDGNGGINTANVDVTINTVNDAPEAVDDALSASSTYPATLDPCTNDTDIESDPLTITAKTDGANGTVVIGGSGTEVTYTSNAGFQGTDSFTYTVDDGNGGTDTATVTVTVGPPPIIVQDSAGNIQSPYQHFHWGIYWIWKASSQTIYTSYVSFCDPNATYETGYIFTGNGCEIIYVP